jgi:hypothetical protein
MAQLIYTKRPNKRYADAASVYRVRDALLRIVIVGRGIKADFFGLA